MFETSADLLHLLFHRGCWDLVEDPPEVLAQLRLPVPGVEEGELPTLLALFVLLDATEGSPTEL